MGVAERVHRDAAAGIEIGIALRVVKPRSLASLEAQLFDRDSYLKLAENLEGFLSRLRDTADTASIESRQKVLRSVVKEILA